MSVARAGRSPAAWGVAIAVVLAALWFWPVVDPRSAQLSCDFGISDDLRAKLNAAAQRLVARDRDAATGLLAAGDHRAVSDLLRDHVREVSANNESAAAKIAAMHAVAHAHGAEFRLTDPDIANPWGADPSDSPDAVFFLYRLDMNRLHQWRVFGRWLRLRGKFAVRDIKPGFEIAREIERNSATLFYTARDVATQLRTGRASAFHPCPPVPSPEWQDAYRVEIAAMKASPGPVDVARPPSDPAANLMRLARNFIDAARLRDALPILERALSVRENNLGANHPVVAETLDSLAEAFANAGQPNRAADYRGRATDIRIRNASRPGVR